MQVSDQAAIFGKKIDPTWAGAFRRASPYSLFILMDGDLAELYQNERVSGPILGSVFGFGDLIACMDIWIGQHYLLCLRTKEIGVS